MKVKTDAAVSFSFASFAQILHLPPQAAEAAD
jgi:hypothetical protein